MVFSSLDASRCWKSSVLEFPDCLSKFESEKNLIKSAIMNDYYDVSTKLGNTFKTHILAAFCGAP